MDAAHQRPNGFRFLENLAYLVPGYRGYKQPDLRHEEDSRLRAHVQRRLQQMRQQLEEIHERWSEEPWGSHVEQLEQRRLRLQTIADSVRYSPYGHQGFFSHDAVDEQVLDRVLEADLLILEDLDNALEHLVDAGCTVTTAPRTVKSFLRAVDTGLGRLERHLIMRERILASA